IISRLHSSVDVQWLTRAAASHHHTALGLIFFHCMKCNCCLGMRLSEHRCREKG
uniref:CTCHY-type domain-containing protein n=1 Tax=Aegilops tauschii subsp. strangulata TaxID=200361 RepID=A0A453SZH1_AEGTS